MRSKHLRILVSFVFVLTAFSPLVQPAAAPLVDPGGKPPSGGMESGGGGGESPSSYGDAYLPSSQTLVNGTQVGGDCGSAWTFLNSSDDLRCSYTEADKSPLDQSVVLLPDGTDTNGWAASGCSTDSSPWDELDDGPDTNDGDTTCRQGSTNGNRVGVTLQNPSWTDAADIDDFTVTSSAVVKKVSSSSAASIGVDVKVGASSYNNGATQATTTSYVRFSRVDTTNPISGQEWTTTDINDLRAATRCVDCSPNNRVTQMQARVDAVYNPEYALEVRFAWAGVPTSADAWFLVVECTRLGLGDQGQNVSLEVGQGGASPTNWKTVARCTSDTDEALDPYALNETEINGGAPIVRLWDAQWDTPDDTVQDVMLLDVMRIDVDAMTAGGVNVAYTHPANLTASYSNVTSDPWLDPAHSAYTYVTTFGNFTIPAAEPHVMSVYDVENRLMATASSFVVEGTPPTNIGSGYVVSANNTAFHSQYNVTSGPVRQGFVDFIASFDSAALPKFEAAFTLDANSTLTSWHIRWKIVTPIHYLMDSSNSTTFFGNMVVPTVIDNEASRAFAAYVGGDAVPTLWNSTLAADWKDVGIGTLYVGPVVVDAIHSGQGMMVAFPQGMSVIDPSLVAESSTSLTTKYANQKKVFFHDGRYYAFYAMGGDTPSIQYSVGREVTTAGWVDPPGAPYGMLWDAPIAVVSASTPRGFDVDARGGLVGLTWYDANKLYFKQGSVNAGVISWQATVEVYSIEIDDAYPPSVAIGSDGIFWLALPAKWNNNYYLLFSWRSAAPGTSSSFIDLGQFRFYTDDLSLVEDYRYAVRLVPLADGRVRMVWTGYVNAQLFWATCCSATGEWYDSYRTLGLDLAANNADANKEFKMSAASFYDSASSENAVRVLYINRNGEVRAVTLFQTTRSDPPTLIDAGPGGHPAIQRDINDDLHMFWTKPYCPGCPERRIAYRWQNVGANILGPVNLFPTSNPLYLSASMEAQPQRAFVVYTQEAPSAYKVRFASLPTRRGGGGAGGASWERPGLSPQGTYFQQLSEFINPGTGLLYIRQTDLSAPGRGLDLAVQRLFRTPDAFDTVNLPWGFDQPGSYYLGRGWSFNFPWMTPAARDIYLWDGQRFVIKWEDNVFENADGEYFKLVREIDGRYTLYSKSGTFYTFIRYPNDNDIVLTRIEDPSGNVIEFAYIQYLVNGRYLHRLVGIVDSTGRDAALVPIRPVLFDYTPTASCPGGTTYPWYVCKVTYGGRTVEYQYAAGALNRVIDPAGRVTSYEYCNSGCGVPFTPVVNGWLLQKVVYPTQAASEYRYAAAQIGPGALMYLAVSQRLKDAAGAIVRKATYSFDIAYGSVVFTKATRYAGDSTVKGETLYVMDAGLGTMTVIQRARQADGSSLTLNQHRLWFGKGGRVEKQEAYMGAAAAAAMTPTYSTFSHFDRFGNLVYTRDALGGEAFQSYVHSDNESAFFAPGQLIGNPAYPGRVWSEDFRDRDVFSPGDWQVGASTGTIALDPYAFLIQPPSLRLRVTTTGEFAVASRTFSTQSTATIVNALVSVDGTIGQRFEVREGVTVRAAASFTDGLIYHNPGGILTSTGVTYQSGKWYHITFRFFKSQGSSLDRYYLVINGEWLPNSFAMTAAGSIDSVWFIMNYFPGALWVNEVVVFKNSSITVGGLPADYRLRLLNARTGEEVDFMESSGGTAFVDSPAHYLPYLTVQVLDREWTPIYTSPVREFWGGSVFSFVEPRFVSDFNKVSSGFLRYSTAWVDDAHPGTATLDREPSSDQSNPTWTWIPDSWRSASGNRYHVAPTVPGRHGHGFRDAADWCPSGPGDFLIQHVYLSPGTLPGEILRAFKHGTASPDAWYRAFWGENLDGLGGTGGTNTKMNMGEIPQVYGRWAMLIVKQGDLDNPPFQPGLQTNCWDASSYYAFNGALEWDLTAMGDSFTGTIRVSEVPYPGQVRMTLKDGTQLTAASDSSNDVVIDLYATGSSLRNAFPIDAQFTVYAGSTPIYDSPWFANVFGGDVFQYDSSNFYGQYGGSSRLPSSIRDRLASTYRVRSDSVVQESYFRYDLKGNLVESKTRGPGGAWITSSRTYNAFGGIDSATTLRDDVNTHTTSYGYDSAFKSAYVTSVFDSVGGVPFTTTLDYDLNTGELTDVTPPSLQGTTSYSYDAVGRMIQVLNPDGTSVNYDYVDWANLVVLKDENYGVDLLRPIVSGSSTAWIPSGCTLNYDCVDEEVADGLGSYVKSAVNGQLDLYGVADSPLPPGTVPVVTVTATVSGAPVDPWCSPSECSTFFWLALRTNGVTYLSPLKSAPGSPVPFSPFKKWTRVSHSWLTNPFSGLAWTVADVNALEVGVKKFVPPYYARTETQVTQVYIEAGTRQQTWRCFDSLGRPSREYRFAEAGPFSSPTCVLPSGYFSLETFGYNWQDLVASHTSPRGPGGTAKTSQWEYDVLGRPTKQINPDATTVNVAYDDALNVKTVTVTDDVQGPRRTEFEYDWNGRPTYVREYHTATSFHETAYDYDDAGNLLRVTTAPDANNEAQVTEHEYDELNRVKKTTFPDGTSETYDYYLAGMVKKKWERGVDPVTGTPVLYAYDELKRADVVTYRDGSSAEYGYDANGNLDALTFNQVGQAAAVLDYTYTNRDWVETETFWIYGTPRTVAYEYDRVGNVKRITEPTSGYDVHYAHDAIGRPCAAAATGPISCNPTTFHAKLSYSADDLVDTITFGNGVTTKYVYDLNTRPTSTETKNGPTSYLRLEYQDYDALGDPTLIQATGQGLSTTTESYVYDRLGRLDTSSASGSWSWSLDYDYDALGNRIKLVDGGTTTHYKYDSYSRLCRTKVGSAPPDCAPPDPGENVYTYHPGGFTASRVVGGTTWSFGWAADGRLAYDSGSQFTAYYGHDGLGRRIRSNIDSTSDDVREYVYSGLSPILEFKVNNPPSVTGYVFAAGLRIAKLDGTGLALEYYHYDHLGSVRVVSSLAGARIATLAYRPFGVCAYGCASEPKYAYTGEYRESAPNLVYLHSRWYDPTIGRFLSPDDRLGRLSMPQDQNRYAYVLNNPMAYTDPTGHLFWLLAGVFLLTFTTTWTVLSAADYYLNGASGAERAGLAWGALAGFLSGLALGLGIAAFCTFTLGIGCAAVAAAAGALMGAVFSSVTYAYATTLYGGTPTLEGVSHAFGLGMIFGGFGGALGARLAGAWGANAAVAARQGRPPTYDVASDAHVRPRHHDWGRNPGASKFAPGEGGQAFADEVYMRSGGVPVVDPRTGYRVYVADLGRTVGYGFPRGAPGYGPWGAQTWGTVVVDPATGRVITQFPGIPRWWP